MPIATSIDKTRAELRRALAELDAAPLYAVIGASDLAVERLRVAGAELATRAANFDAKALRDEAQAHVEAIQADVLRSPEQVTELPAKAQAAVGEAISVALTTYGRFVGRGKELANRVSQQEASQDLHERAKNTPAEATVTATKVKGQAATAKKTAARKTAAKKSAARKSAAKKAPASATPAAKKTKTSANAAATSARKTKTSANAAAASAKETKTSANAAATSARKTAPPTRVSTADAGELGD